VSAPAAPEISSAELVPVRLLAEEVPVCIAIKSLH
jgi:hypothetical protein